MQFSIKQEYRVMRLLSFLILLAWVAFLAYAAAFATDAIEVYNNTRYGYAISLPQGIFRAQPESDSGDGKVFNAKNHHAKLTVWGGYVLFDKTYYQKLIRDGHNTKLTYHAEGSNWFVISGQQDNQTIYYHKTVFEPIKNSRYAAFTLE